MPSFWPVPDGRCYEALLTSSARQLFDLATPPSLRHTGKVTSFKTCQSANRSPQRAACLIDTTLPSDGILASSLPPDIATSTHTAVALDNKASGAAARNVVSQSILEIVDLVRQWRKGGLSQHCYFHTRCGRFRQQSFWRSSTQCCISKVSRDSRLCPSTEQRWLSFRHCYHHTHCGCFRQKASGAASRNVVSQKQP